MDTGSALGRQLHSPLPAPHSLAQQAVVVAARADRQRPLPGGIQLGQHHLVVGRGGKGQVNIGALEYWLRAVNQTMAQLALKAASAQRCSSPCPRGKRLPQCKPSRTVILRGPLVPSTLVWYIAAPSSHRPPGLPAHVNEDRMRHINAATLRIMTQVINSPAAEPVCHQAPLVIATALPCI